MMTENILPEKQADRRRSGTYRVTVAELGF